MFSANVNRSDHNISDIFLLVFSIYVYYFIQKFNILDSIEQSLEAARPAISATSKINIKDFGLYDAYCFNIYSSNGTLKGNGLAYQPMGLYVDRAMYAK